MSSVSVTSSKRERLPAEAELLAKEIDSLRTMNKSLQAYLDYLRSFKNNLIAVNDNCKQLNKINNQWVDALNVKN